MPATLSTIDAILKEFYEGAIRDTLNNEILLKKYLGESKKQWSGRRVTFPVHLGRNVGVGARSEGAIIPPSGDQANTECRVTASYLYGRIDLTGQTVAASKNAFAENLAYEMEGLANDIMFDCGRQSYGDGVGILAQVGLSSNSNSLVRVFNQYAEPGQNGGRYISVSQVIDIGTVAAPETINSGTTVISVAIAANSSTTVDTITFSNSAMPVCSTQHFLFNNDAGGVGIEIKGLRAIVDDVTAVNMYASTGGYLNNATLQNIDRNTQLRWNAVVIGNSVAERLIDSSIMQQAFDKVKRNSGKMIKKIFGEYEATSAFLDSVSGDRRFATKNFDAGVSELSYNGIPLVQDLLAPYNEMYLLGEDALSWYVMKDFEWADDDGRILKNIASRDRWEAFMRFYGQLGAEAPNRCAVIRDIRTSL